MKKRKARANAAWKGAIILCIILSIFAVFFTSCTKYKGPDEFTSEMNDDFGKDKDKDKDKDKNKVQAVELTDKALGGNMLIDFTKGADASVVFESDGWTNGDVFNVVWAKDNVKYENGIFNLVISLPH